MKRELKPCPFCGDLPIEDEEEYSGYRKRYTINCHNCGLTMFSLTKSDVKKAWNTRDESEIKHLKSQIGDFIETIEKKNEIIENLTFDVSMLSINSVNGR